MVMTANYFAILLQSWLLDASMLDRHPFIESEAVSASSSTLFSFKKISNLAFIEWRYRCPGHRQIHD